MIGCWCVCLCLGVFVGARVCVCVCVCVCMFVWLCAWVFVWLCVCVIVPQLGYALGVLTRWSSVGYHRARPLVGSRGKLPGGSQVVPDLSFLLKLQ